jgi:hypothetical protein
MAPSRHQARRGAAVPSQCCTAIRRWLRSAGGAHGFERATRFFGYRVLCLWTRARGLQSAVTLWKRATSRLPEAPLSQRQVRRNGPARQCGAHNRRWADASGDAVPATLSDGVPLEPQVAALIVVLPHVVLYRREAARPLAGGRSCR